MLVNEPDCTLQQRAQNLISSRHPNDLGPICHYYLLRALLIQSHCYAFLLIAKPIILFENAKVWSDGPEIALLESKIGYCGYVKR